MKFWPDFRCFWRFSPRDGNGRILKLSDFSNYTRIHNSWKFGENRSSSFWERTVNKKIKKINKNKQRSNIIGCLRCYARLPIMTWYLPDLPKPVLPKSLPSLDYWKIIFPNRLELLKYDWIWKCCFRSINCMKNWLARPHITLLGAKSSLLMIIDGEFLIKGNNLELPGFVLKNWTYFCKHTGQPEASA